MTCTLKIRKVIVLFLFCQKYLINKGLFAILLFLISRMSQTN